MIIKVKEFIEKVARENEHTYFLYIDGFRYPWLENIEKLYPNRVIPCGISEQLSLSISTSLALSGNKVYVFMIAAYASKRALDQFKFACYCNANITVITTLSGLAVPYAGYSHLAIDDISILRNSPNLSIYSPSSPVEIEVILEHHKNMCGPVYIGIDNRGEYPALFDAVYGKKTLLHLGNSKVCILYSGFAGSFLSLDRFLNVGLNPTIYSIYILEPFNVDEIRELCKKYPILITVEFKGKGCLASSVAEIIATEKFKTQFLPIYLKDEKYDVMGQCDYVAEKYLQLTQLPHKILNLIGYKKVFVKRYAKFQKNDCIKIKYKFLGITLLTVLCKGKETLIIESFLFDFLKIYKKSICCN